MNELLDQAAISLLNASGGFMLFMIVGGLIFTAWFQFKIFKSLERSRLQIAAEISEIRGLIGQHDIRIIHLEHEISWVKGNMLTMELVKRVEMMVASLPRESVADTLLAALRAEIRVYDDRKDG